MFLFIYIYVFKYINIQYIPMRIANINKNNMND